jgi:hypothetical protein
MTIMIGETPEAAQEHIREAWKSLEDRGVRIAQVSAFPLDVEGTYAKLTHFPRSARHHLQIRSGLNRSALLLLLRKVQLQLNEPAARWTYHPEQRHIGVEEQRVCAYVEAREPERVIGTKAKSR